MTAQQYRDPRDLVVFEVCPYCKCEVRFYVVSDRGVGMRTQARCIHHGHVTPIKSHVLNR